MAAQILHLAPVRNPQPPDLGSLLIGMLVLPLKTWMPGRGARPASAEEVEPVDRAPPCDYVYFLAPQLDCPAAETIASFSAPVIRPSVTKRSEV
jgi:hypothetical protein